MHVEGNHNTQQGNVEARGAAAGCRATATADWRAEGPPRNHRENGTTSGDIWEKSEVTTVYID